MGGTTTPKLNSRPYSSTLERLPAAQLRNCVACRETPANPKQLILRLQLGNIILHLCSTCELDLLANLLNNYVKRLGKKRLTTLLYKEPLDATPDIAPS